MPSVKATSMLKNIFLTSLLFAAGLQADAQFTYKIKADSVKVTNDSCTAELIIENSTRNVPGYLYNIGNGRTEFRSVSSSGDWMLSGNSGITVNQFLGTTDTGSIVFKTNSRQRGSIRGDGAFTIGPNDTATSPLFRFYPNGDLGMSAPGRNYTTANYTNGGIRYHRRLGYFEIGTRNIIDTTISEAYSVYKTGGIIVNTGDLNHFNGKIKNSVINASNADIATDAVFYFSLLTGGKLTSTANIAHSVIVGENNKHSLLVNGIFVNGTNHQLDYTDRNSIYSGDGHKTYAATYSNIVGGINNNIGSAGQLTVGNRLHNRSFAGTALGNGNVDFTSLPYNAWVDTANLNILPNYLLFSIGNSQSKTAAHKSNAITMLYSGRTQINTTGFTDSLTETAATPKAALEVVSRNSGVLLPKLTTAQRDSIVSGDLYSGLLLFNTTTNRFEYYNGTAWTGIGSGSSGGSGIQSLKDSAQVKWDYAQGSLKTVRLSGNRTLSISNLQSGARGKLIIRQDSTGLRTLTLPANSFVDNENNGSLGLTPVAGGIDIASFVYDGTNFYWTVQKGFTSAPKVARFNFNATEQYVAGWNDVTGNPHQAVRTATDWITGIGISSIATGKWGPFGGVTSYNGLGESSANPTFIFGPQVTSSYWYCATNTYSTSADCNLEINGLQAGATYNIEILASRENADVTQPQRYMRLVCVDNAGASFVEDFDVKGNTANLVTFYNKTPNGSGKILLFIGKKNPADANHAFGYINGLRITKL